MSPDMLHNWRHTETVPVKHHGHGLAYSGMPVALSMSTLSKETDMKKQTKNKCQVCGKRITVIIRGKSGTEKLCSQCLLANYPALKELSKLM